MPIMGFQTIKSEIKSVNLHAIIPQLHDDSTRK